MFKVSVIIATYNRCEQLSKCVDSLLAQKTDGSNSIEIIVADNNSTDQTNVVISDYESKTNGQVKYAYAATPGKSHALNEGLKAAEGDIIAFTDDDVSVHPQWMSTLVKTFEDHQCDCVGGRVLPIYPKDTPEWIKGDKEQMPGIVIVCDNGEETKKFEKGMNEFIGANYAFKRDVFQKVGTFRTDMGPGLSRPTSGEDREFVSRCINSGLNIYYCGQALIEHPVDLSRSKLKHIIAANIALGRAAAIKECENTQVQPVILWGAPRYLYKGIVIDCLSVLRNIFDKRSRFNSLRSLYRKWGMILEYRDSLRMKFSGEQVNA